MGADGTEYEYPDEAGYPDGGGMLHEGTDGAADDGDESTEDAADAVESDVDHFAMEDEEDSDENV